MANMATQMECTKKGELYDFLQNLVARDNQPDCSLKPTQAPAVDSQPDSGLKPFPAPDQTTRMYTYQGYRDRTSDKKLFKAYLSTA